MDVCKVTDYWDDEMVEIYNATVALLDDIRYIRRGCEYKGDISGQWLIDCQNLMGMLEKLRSGYTGFKYRQPTQQELEDMWSAPLEEETNEGE